MNLAAAIDDGIFDTGAGTQHRVLLASTNSQIPESTVPLQNMAGFAAIARRFDHVVDWNAILAPFTPQSFKGFGEPVVTAKWLQSHLGLDDQPVELILESIQVHPARGLADLFTTAPITIYSDGLMSYGPTRSKLPLSLGLRISRVVYLDLLPGVQPRLLHEFDVETLAIRNETFSSVLTETAELAPEASATALMLQNRSATALVLGQYLGALGILSTNEEIDIYTSIAASAAAGGHEVIAFKPHPTAPPLSGAITERARRLGVEVVEVPGPISVEHMLHSWRPDLVAGCFSTGLLIAQRFFGLNIASGGTEIVLERLKPFENSNRVPLTVIDAVVPTIDTDVKGTLAEARIDLAAAPDAVQGVIDVTAFLMQPALHKDFKSSVAQHIRHMDSEICNRYVGAAQLKRHRLPGESPSRRQSLELRTRALTSKAALNLRRYPRLARTCRSARAALAVSARRVTKRVPAIDRLVRSFRH